MTPTEEQQHILSVARDSNTSMIINAYAGTGKTTTLELLTGALPFVPSLALAFNVKIKEELARRFPENFTVLTMNGLGHRTWMKLLPRKPKVDSDKLRPILAEVVKEFNIQLEDEEWGQTRQLVSHAMAAGLVPSIFPVKSKFMTDTEANWKDVALDADLNPDLWELSREVLIRSINKGFGKGGVEPVISFDDQIYLPTLFGGNFPKFPLVMVDEAQDLSPLQHEMIRRTATGRLIVVGDPKQAIYGFRGADSSSMENLRKLRPEWEECPLTLTFRCPKAIVERQQSHAPGYRAAESNTEGEVIDLRDKPQGWSWNDIPKGQVAVLCRLNGPIVSLALKLLAKKIKVVILGRDFGKGLIALAKKIIPDKSLPTEACIALINSWKDHEVGLAQANEKLHKIQGIEDRAACLLAVLEYCATADDLLKTLREIFEREVGEVTLASGHRSKGLEWDIVVHLNPDLIPSHYARKAAAEGRMKQMEQELNLRYVIETRTKNTFVLANIKEFSQ